MTFPSQPSFGNSGTRPDEGEPKRDDSQECRVSAVRHPEISTTDLIAAICHDLRPHVGLLKGFADSVRQLTESSDPAHRDDALRGLVASADSISALASQLLNVVTVGAAPLSPRAWALSELLRDASSDVAALLRPGQAIVVEPLPKVVVVADELRIRWVLRNLLVNASQYSAVNQVIGISAQAEPTRVVISVTDRGIGIDAPSRSRIFEARFRSDQAREIAEGLGLGLYLCRRIVEAHGGEIWFDSVPGSGSIFHFSLSRAK